MRCGGGVVAGERRPDAQVGPEPEPEMRNPRDPLGVEALRVGEGGGVVIGGGHAKLLNRLPRGVRRGANANAFLGGYRLWKVDGRGLKLTRSCS